MDKIENKIYSEKTNIFREMLIEKYREMPKNGDIVAKKRKHFETILATANESLRKNNYSEAKQNYFDVIEYLKNVPYPDELNLLPDTEFAIKCCFCYSSLRDENFCANTVVNLFSKQLLENLVEEYNQRLFPKYLKALFHYQKKNWVMTLYWCNVVEDHTEEEENYYADIDFFEELLPGILDIKTNVEIWQEHSFYGYGKELAKKTVSKPKVEKYLLWLRELKNRTANKLSLIREPISSLDLHKILHEDIFPLWNEGQSAREINVYYDNSYVTHCNECIRAKASITITHKNQDEGTKINVTGFSKGFCEVGQSVDTSVDKLSAARELKRKIDAIKRIQINIGDLIESPKDFGDLNKDSKEDNRLSVAAVKSKIDAIDMKMEQAKALRNKTTNISTQTDKIRMVHKYLQTDEKSVVKTRSIEVQVNSDPPVLSAVLDMKNKMLVNQEKKDNEISKLNRTVQELTEKLNRTVLEHAQKLKKERNDSNKKLVTAGQYEFQNNQLVKIINEYKENLKLQTEKNVHLQKCLLDQVNQVYKTYKHIYKTFQDKSSSIVSGLREINTFLIKNSILSEDVSNKNIDIWTTHLSNANKYLNSFNVFYKEIKNDIINCEKFSVTWPDLPEYPREDDVIFNSIIRAIESVVNTNKKENEHLKSLLQAASVSNKYVQPTIFPALSVEPHGECQDVHKQTPSAARNIASEKFPYAYQQYQIHHQHSQRDLHQMNQEKKNSRSIQTHTQQLPQAGQLEQVYYTNQDMYQMNQGIKINPSNQTHIQQHPQVPSHLLYPAQMHNTNQRQKSYASNEVHTLQDPHAIYTYQGRTKSEANETHALQLHQDVAQNKKIMNIYQGSLVSEYENGAMRIERQERYPRTGPTSQFVKTDDVGQETEKMLLQYVIENCSFNTEQEVTLALLQVIDDNRGTLSHLPQEKILEDVKVILRMKRQTQPKAWNIPKSPHVDWKNDNTESCCSICFEEFAFNETYTLQCQHKFHKECIKSWLRVKSVCPICRIHSVIDEEFPPLYK